MLRERSESGAKHEVPPQSGEARREYENSISRGGIVDKNVPYGTKELSVLNYTPIGASALCALGAARYSMQCKTKRSEFSRKRERVSIL